MCRSKGQRAVGGWLDVVWEWKRLASRTERGAGELEGHVHKLLPVRWGLIEKAGKGMGPHDLWPHTHPL